MSEDLGTGPSRDEELRGAQPPGRTDEGSEWQRAREGDTGSGEADVVDTGKVDETGSARDAAAREEPDGRE